MPDCPKHNFTLPEHLECPICRDERRALVSLGDYVLATKYSDCDPQDPWCVGFVVRIIRDKRGETYIIGEQDGTWSDFREYKHAKKITADEGRAWLEANSKLSGAS